MTSESAPKRTKSWVPINIHVKNVTEPYGIPLWHKIFAIARNFYNVLRSLAFSPKLFVVFCLECQQPGGSTCDLAADKQQRGTCHLTIHSHRLQSLKLSRLLLKSKHRKCTDWTKSTNPTKTVQQSSPWPSHLVETRQKGWRKRAIDGNIKL